MLLYRSIDENELFQLLNGNVIFGQYNCETESQNTENNKNVCCFFVDEMRWKDSNHEFMITVDIPKEDLTFGIGTYFASKSLRNTKIWTGRNGQELYHIREAYAYMYSISQVKELFLFGRFANHFVNDKIKPICDKYNIKCHHTDANNPFLNSSQYFVKYKAAYVTNEFTDNWLESMTTDKTRYIQDLKQLVLSSDITFEQARQIKGVLTQTPS